MIKNLLQHKIRKDILSNNKKINHKSFLRSMNVATKIPYLMSYHKKKLIFAVVLGIVSWTYSLHKCTPFYYFSRILLVTWAKTTSQNFNRSVC